jgi:alpha-1,6-mannosyltransferase
MKIVDVCEFYSPTGGGVRNYVEQRFDAATRCGHELVVIAPGAENRIEKRGAGKLIWVESPRLPLDRNYRMFWRGDEAWRILDQESPSIVEGSSPWRGGWIAAQWPGAARKVLFMHADPIAVYPQTWLGGTLGYDRVDRAFGWFWRYLRNLNAQFDATIVTGAWLGHRFSNLGLKRIEVVPFGIDRAHFGPHRRSSATRSRLLARCGLDESASLLVAIGRHHPEKRFDLLIAAVARAHRTRPIGLVILGDGLIRGMVERWAARHSNVHVAGHIRDRSELAEILASADALLHGSASETYGFAVAEALCSGTPVIVPDRGGAVALAGPNHAEVYRAGDQSAAAAAILRCLAKERGSTSRAVTRAAGDLVRSAEEHFDALFRFYESLAGGTAQMQAAIVAA